MFVKTEVFKKKLYSPLPKMFVMKEVLFSISAMSFCLGNENISHKTKQKCRMDPSLPILNEFTPKFQFDILTDVNFKIIYY